MQELSARVDAYMALESEVKSPAGLAVFLGMGTEGLQALAQGKSRRAALLRCAMARMEKELIEGALRGKYNATMSAFLLKSEFGYREKRGEASEPSSAIRVELDEPLERLAE